MSENIVNREICFIMCSLSCGGSQRVISLLANYLADKGYNIEIILTLDKIIEYKLDDRIVVNASLVDKNNLSSLVQLRKKIKESKDTVYISFLDNENIKLLICNLFLHRKVILSVRHEPSKSFPGRPYLRYLSKWLYGLADTVVFQTEDGQRQFSRYVREKSHIIMNPLKEDLPMYLSEEREKKVVTACRLAVEKNLYMAIDAFEIFHKTHSDYRFEIYGKGELKESLQQYIDDKDMNECIELCGFHEEVHEHLKDAMMFILTSDYEGMPNALMEAMAIGLPAISTDCPAGGPRELIEDNYNGKLVAIGDRKAMAEAMSRVADHREYRDQLSRNAVKIREKCTVEKIGQQWEELFENEKDRDSTNNKETEERDDEIKKGKKGMFLLLLLALAISVIFLLLCAELYINVTLGKVQRTRQYEKEEVYAYETGSKVENIVLLGIDEDDGTGRRSDLIKIITLDYEKYEVRLTSLQRDNIVYLPMSGSYEKLNNAYTHDGVRGVLSAINYSFDTDVTRYVLVNGESFSKIIDQLGGLKIEMSEEEAREIGVECEKGVCELDGEEALEFAGERLNGEYERMERGTRIMDEIMKKLKKSSIVQLAGIVKEILPQIETNLTHGELKEMIKDILRFDLDKIEQYQFPEGGKNAILTYLSEDGKNLQYILKDYSGEVEKMHEFIYGKDEGYTASERVKEVEKEVLKLIGKEK